MKCPSCGGELRFEPSNGMLQCSYCASSFDPGDPAFAALVQSAEEQPAFGQEAAGQVPQMQPQSQVQDQPQAQVPVQDQSQMQAQSQAVSNSDQTKPQEEESEPRQELDMVLYTCPNCGGTLYSVEESINAFCSFCGSQVMLQSRFAKMKAPAAVIPFQIDKEKCKSLFSEKVKKAFFAPKELKDPGCLDNFRGIYMPYYIYNIRCQGPFQFSGKRVYMTGDYEITETYNCVSTIDAHYFGLSYDGSAAFDDSISEVIAPYDTKKMYKFNPAYLTGFYADMADIPSSVYVNDAGGFARESIYNVIDKMVPEFSAITPLPGTKESIPLYMREKDIDTAFFPVWFLSYKNKNRVAYAVVNGQTGKVSCDLPVDKFKFLLFAFLLAIPIYLVMMIIPTFMPQTMLGIIQVLGIIGAIMTLIMVNKAVDSDQKKEDKGFQYKYGVPGNVSKKKKTTDKKNTIMKVVIGVFIAFVVIQICPFVFDIFGDIARLLGFNIFAGSVQTVAIFVLIINAISKAKPLKNKTVMIAGGILLCVASLIGTVLTAAGAANDMFYYTAAALIGTGVVLNFIGILDIFEVLLTRPLPQLNREGGEMW